MRPRLNIVDQRIRQVLMNTTGAEIGRMQARTTGPLVKDHQLFALFKAPQRRGQRANVHRLRGYVEQVVQNPAYFGIEHPDQRRTTRYFHAGQLFDGQTPGMFLVHRRHIVEAVEIRQILQIRPALHQLFGAAVQQADMRITTLNDFAVQLQHQTQNAVCRRVLRAEVDVEVTDLLFAGQGVVHFGAVHYFAPSFSSPGRIYSAPSHGLMKSNWRYS